MSKYRILILFCLIFLGCILRKQNTETSQEKINEVSKADNENSINYYDQYGNFNEKSYTLRTPDLEELLGMQNIEILWIKTDSNPIVDFTFLEKLPQLKELYIHGYGIRRNKNVNLDFIKNIHNLEQLWLETESIIIDGTLFSHLTNLKRLELSGNGIINNGEILALPNLEYLGLSFYHGKIIIENITSISKLKLLDIFAAEVDLENIGNLQRLNYLRLHSPKIINLQKIDNPLLESVYLESFGGMESYSEINIDVFQNLKRLKNISVIHFGIQDISPLIYLPNLESIRFSRNSIDIMPLLKNKNIKEINIDTWNYNEKETEIFKQHGMNIYWEGGVNIVRMEIE